MLYPLHVAWKKPLISGRVNKNAPIIIFILLRIANEIYTDYKVPSLNSMLYRPKCILIFLYYLKYKNPTFSFTLSTFNVIKIYLEDRNTDDICINIFNIIYLYMYHLKHFSQFNDYRVRFFFVRTTWVCLKHTISIAQIQTHEKL